MTPDPTPTRPGPAPLHVIFGAGPVGRATATALLAQGHRVRVVSRTRPLELPGALGQPIEHVVGDVLGDGVARDAARGADVVYFCLNAPYTSWPRDFPPLQAAVVDAAADAGAVLVVFDNLYGFSPPTEPLREDSSRAPASVKGRVRKAMDDALWDAHAQGRVRVVVGRASDLFGPTVSESGLGARQIDAVLAGGAAELCGDGRPLHSFCFVDDVGRALAMLGTAALTDAPAVVGRSWLLPALPARAPREVLDDVAALARDRAPLARGAGAPLRVRLLSSRQTRLLGAVVPIVREVHEMRYQWDAPFVVDDSAFRVAFPFVDTPWPVALERTVAARAVLVTRQRTAARARRRTALAAFVVDNLWIGVAAALAWQVPRLLPFFAGNETLPAVVMGLYWLPALRKLTLAALARAARVVTTPTSTTTPNTPTTTPTTTTPTTTTTTTTATTTLKAATTAATMARAATVTMMLALALPACGGPPATLSETGLYEDIGAHVVNDDAQAFAPRFSLWSDGAEKSRWVMWPTAGEGGEAGVVDTDDMDAWVFPVGTRFWKEFRRDGRRVETRMTEKRADGWVAASYLWNDDESDATLAPFFGQENLRGTAHDAPWAPSCTFCHGDAELLLGFTAVQLAHDGDGVTLASLVAEGRLSAPPSSTSLVVPGDERPWRGGGG